MRDMINERRQQLAELNKKMKVFGRLPAGYGKWVENELFKEETYLAFDNKTRRAFCTACNTEYDIDKNYKHNSIGECPVCGQQVRFVREDVEKYRESVKWTLVIQRRGENLLFRYIRNIKRYGGRYRKHEISCLESLRTIHRKDDCDDFQYFWGIGGWLPYREQQWNIFHQPNNYDMPKKGVTLYQPEKLPATIKNSWAKNSGLTEYVQHYGSFYERSYDLENYLWRYREYPWMEKLAKVGFFKLLEYYRSFHYDSVPLQEDAPTLRGVLGIGRHQLKLLHHAGDPRHEDLRLVREHPTISADLFDRIRNNSDWLLHRNELIVSGKADEKLLDLLESSNAKFKDYTDYRDWLKRLGYDMNDKAYKYPRDFWQEHDRVMVEYQDLQDRLMREKEEKMSELIRLKYFELIKLKAMELKRDGLFITAPKNVGELKKEGRVLHHCVGTYAERVAEGETNIFFIRRESEPDKPFYTLEWNGEIVQCRGKGNCLADGIVKDFAERFDATMKLSA